MRRRKADHWRYLSVHFYDTNSSVNRLDIFKEISPGKESVCMIAEGISTVEQTLHENEQIQSNVLSISSKNLPYFIDLMDVHKITDFRKTIPSSELVNCCQPERPSTQSEYWDSCHTSAQLRDRMMKIAKRLTSNETLVLVDTHCHFDLIFDRLYIRHNNLKKYFDDYKDLYPTGLSFQLAIHVFWRPKQLAQKNWTEWYSNYLNDERVFGSCGIHPHWSALWTEKTIKDLERCLQHPKVVAIGEIGLDFGPKNTCNADVQCRVFIEQLKLAVKWSKPVVIHSRNAYEKTFELMKQYLPSNHKIHLHCFLGTMEDIQLFTSYFTEIKFGFTPLITRGNTMHTVLQQLDLRQMLSETDSPYFLPEELSHLSRSAHPGMVYSVVETIAQLRQISLHTIAEQLKANAYSIYGIGMF